MYKQRFYKVINGELAETVGHCSDDNLSVWFEEDSGFRCGGYSAFNRTGLPTQGIFGEPEAAVRFELRCIRLAVREDLRRLRENLRRLREPLKDWAPVYNMASDLGLEFTDEDNEIDWLAGELSGSALRGEENDED